MSEGQGCFLCTLNDHLPKDEIPGGADIICFGLPWPHGSAAQNDYLALAHLGQSEDTAREMVKNGLIVVYQRSIGLVRAYLNRCPHQFTPLEIMPGRFLDRENKHLLCATHGATFRINDGFCLSGPCAGQALTEIPVMLKDGALYVCVKSEA